MRSLPFALVLAAAFLTPTTLLAAPPTDEQIAAAVQKYKSAKPQSREEATIAATKAMDEIAIDEMTAAQFETLGEGRILALVSPALRQKLNTRATTLAEGKNADGAIAAGLLADLVEYPGDQASPDQEKAFEDARLGLIAKAAKHPGLGEALRSGHGFQVFASASMSEAADLKKAGVIEALTPFITADLPTTKIQPVLRFVSTVVNPEGGLDQAGRNKVADSAVALLDKAIPAVKADEPNADRMKKWYADQKRYFGGAYVRGTLMNNPAPSVKVAWSTNPKFTSFADLKGKVVLVDYWATWCGPCVRAFPHVRELTAKYKDYPVEILGVTSVQGYHMKRTLAEGTKPERIDCKDDAKKEMELMKDFIKDMNMTWTVAFTEESCFNPDFGVQGIPHLALIDPAGKVRFNELRPGDPTLEDKIDGLLKEFKIEPPAAMPKKADEKAGG